MKTIWLIIFHILSSLVLVAQTGTITNIAVSQRTDGSGLVDIHFDLSGGAAAYNLILEVSLDGGSTFVPISESHLAGDKEQILQGDRKHVIWNAQESFPNAYSLKTVVKIIAIEDTGGSAPLNYTISIAASIPLAVERAGVNSNVVDNNIYIFGGYPGTEPYSNKIFKYNTLSNSWTDLGPVLPYGFIELFNNVSIYSSTTLYITPSRGPFNNNGWGLNKNIMEYSIPSNSISNRTPFPEYSWAIASSKARNYIYMFGRHTGSDHRNIFRYNPNSDELVDLGNILPQNTSAQVILQSNNGKTYLFGGRHQKKSLIIFDPDNETIVFHAENIMPFEMGEFSGGALWESGNIIYIIDTATGKIYEFNKLVNSVELSQFQIFNDNIIYRPLVSMDGSTGIVYLISGREGNSLVKTVRVLNPVK